jgi:hypothetical protein
MNTLVKVAILVIKRNELEISMAEKMSRSKTIIVSIVIVVIAVIIIGRMGGGGSDSGTQEKKEESTITLNASVNFTGTQFVITNNNDFDWTGVKLEVNSQGLRSGYVLKTARMSSGETYTVGAMQFTKKDGEKFNPGTYKPLNFSIWCDTPSGKNGHYYGGWE